jgi:uncharacterized lipoprotein YmbA
MTHYRAIFLSCMMAAAVGGCAGPPLQLYTLASFAVDGAADGAVPLTATPQVIEVARVSIPDTIDSEDILVRDGATLHRSSKGRWASRLSIGITDLVTSRLAAKLPDTLVTDQPQAGPVSARLMINISRLDVSSSGAAMLSADWTIVPADPATPLRRDRTSVREQGAVTNDQDVVALIRDLVGKLSDAITVRDVGRDAQATASGGRCPASRTIE